jgi:hypothetical protein
MSGDTIECFNCGHANPSWAQVCRSCGFPLQANGPASGAPAGIFPTDQASLISIGGTLGAIVLAIVLGLFFSRLIPPAPNVAEETPSPTPSPSVQASISQAPSVSASALASPQLPGTVTFGTGWDNTARQITGNTTAFTAASAGFAHAISLNEPIGVDRLQEEVVRVAADGTETVVQSRADGTVFVNPKLQTDGLKSPSSMTKLISAWGTGTHILRVYRGGELLAEGTFTFS